MRIYFLCLFGMILLLPLVPISAQTKHLQPGFDKQEYAEMLKISNRQVDTPLLTVTTPEPNNFTLSYRSKVVGLDNRWDLWTSNDSVAVISLRGTTLRNISWIENFYAAMVPAAGQLQLNNQLTFQYHLANNPDAAVHTGWLIGMAFLSQDILPKIDSLYKKGTKNIIILGHSQGGAIAYLLSSHIAYLQETHQLPADIQFKTYCSASPKPGNLFYAYEYEKQMANGWGFNVVNAADWVPQGPLSVEALSDFNTTNPFVNAAKTISKQPFPKNIALQYAFNQMNNASKRANKRYEKYLGKMVAGIVKKAIPEFQIPKYYKSFDYVRVGPTVVLLPDTDYYLHFPNNPTKIFVHHNFDAYLYLCNQLK